MVRRKVKLATLRVLVQTGANRWEWVKPCDFNDRLEPILMQADGLYVAVKF